MQMCVRILGLLALCAMSVGCCCVDRSPCGGGACGPVGPAPCATGACGSGCCPSLIGAVASAVTCNTGCGERYYDEWISDPPDCCDPCDNCGNWTGPQPCCRPLSILNPCNWFGIRYYDDCGGCGVCSACLPVCDGCGGGGCDSCGGHGGEYIETIQQPQPALPTPPPMPATARTKAKQRPYYTRSASTHNHVR